LSSLSGLTNANLVAHWNLNEGAGTIIHDSAESHDGTISGTTNWTNGNFDDAINFTHGYVSVPTNTSLNNFSQLTISAWIYWTGTPSKYDFLVGKEWVYKIDLTGNRVRFLTGNNWAGSILTSQQTISQNQWYHIAAVYDGAEKSIYINGIKDGNIVYTSGIVNSSSYPLMMGAQPSLTPGTYEDYYQGKIDEVRLYNHALTSEEIRALAVPEPLTFSLLSIGGLVLLRKK
jgi:hypothetical protein